MLIIKIAFYLLTFELCDCGVIVLYACILCMSGLKTL